MTHDLLQAAKAEKLSSLLNGVIIYEYLCLSWVQRHQSVKPFIENLEIEIKNFETTVIKKNRKTHASLL